jgi:flagellar hook-associated protein 2
VSSTSSTSSTTSGTLGNAPPVSFPGIASGIDYDSIIEKYTADTLEQEKPTQLQVNNLNSQNTAILKITNLIGAVQDSLTNLSDPSIFGAYSATVNAADGANPATTSQIAGTTPLAGTYTIDSQTAATATTITNATSANGVVSETAALSAAGLAITPTDGAAANGIFTINGVSINYNADTTTLDNGTGSSIVAELNAALQSTTGGTATYNATTGQITLTGVTSLGSGGDSGNLEQVLKLDTAQISGGTVTSSTTIGGINENSILNQNNNAGFATGVTSGTFTINGVQFTVNSATDTLGDIINDINSSAAGVTASYNTETSQLQLVSTTPGPQSILLSATSDTSNFLTAVGLKTGATVQTGTQAQLTYTDSQGTFTVFSATNSFTSAIPGIDLNVQQSTSTPYSVTVAADPTKAEAAINAFITAYNAAITELNTDTVAPTVTAGTDSSTGTSTSSSSGGGVLYGNYQISSLKEQLVDLVSGFVPTGSNSYNSLASVGILLDTDSEAVGATDADADSSTKSSDDTSSANNNFSVNATSGQLAALDTTTFEAAYAANTQAVSALFTQTPTLTGGTSDPQPEDGSPYGFAYQFGSELANVDGLSTFLKSSVITPADLSAVLLTSITDSNNQQIDSLEQQISIINQEATAQADSLRAQFTASETQIAELQALQGQISAIGH